MKKNEFLSLIEIVAVSILASLVVNFAWLINKQNKKIEKQENRIQQQIELIDALQQGEGN